MISKLGGSEGKTLTEMKEQTYEGWEGPEGAPGAPLHTFLAEQGLSAKNLQTVDKGNKINTFEFGIKC